MLAIYLVNGRGKLVALQCCVHLPVLGLPTGIYYEKNKIK